MHKNEDVPVPSEPKDEISQLMIIDRRSEMTTDELFKKWGSQFGTVAEFYRQLEITNPPYEEFYLQKLRETYGEFLTETYQKEFDLTGPVEPFELEILKIEERDIKPSRKSDVPNKNKASKLRIITYLLPISEIGLENVKSDYIDISMDLFERLKKYKQHELLRRVLIHLIAWEKKYEKRVTKDGNILSQRENQ